MKSQTRKIATTATTTTMATLAALSLVACSAKSTTAASSGSDRLVWQNQSLTFDTTGGIGQDMNAASYNSGNASAQAVSVPLALNQIASLASPVSGGNSLQANAIVYTSLLTNKAYVAYNTQGAATAGGIDVIDFTTPSAPVMTSHAIYPNIDINAVYVTLTDLYAVGADDSDNPAHLYDFALASGNITGTPSNTVQLSGYTGVAVTGDLLNIYAATGDNGGVTVLPKITLLQSSYTPVTDVRDMSVDALGINVLVGTTSTTAPHYNRYSLLGLLNGSSANFTSGASADGGKASLQAGTILNLATAGTGGTNLVCGISGTVMANIPIPTSAQFPNLTADLRAANSATFGGGLIYVANGAAGISVYTMELTSIVAGCNVTTTYVGRITFPDGVSVNNVVYNAGKLIVATGLGGFRIIQVTQGVSVGGLGLQLTL